MRLDEAIFAPETHLISSIVLPPILYRNKCVFGLFTWSVAIHLKCGNSVSNHITKQGNFRNLLISWSRHPRIQAPCTSTTTILLYSKEKRTTPGFQHYLFFQATITRDSKPHMWNTRPADRMWPARPYVVILRALLYFPVTLGDAYWLLMPEYAWHKCPFCPLVHLTHAWLQTHGQWGKTFVNKQPAATL